MKFYLLTFLLILTACASCQFTKDLGTAPATLDQARLPIQVGDAVELGIQGSTGEDTIRVRSYAEGSVSIRGLNDCGYVSSASTKSAGWVEFDASRLPQNEFCLFNLETWTNGLDAPAIGNLLIRRFLDPNVKPLKTTMNQVTRVNGLNWVQLQSGPKLLTVGAGGGMRGGILEDRHIAIFPSGKSGKLVITGCGIPANVTEYSDQPEWDTTVDYLYSSIGGVNKSCVFTITANNNDALAESATIYVKVYQQSGSFLNAPIIAQDSDQDEACFEFVDPYVVGMSVNGQWSYRSHICAPKADKYI
ncbi:MAG: hypothetical protein ACXWPM_00105, partial [Bdellovibrionota bacterium]